MKLAPICFFGYKRLECTKQTIEALQKNFLAKETDLFIFVDGPKSAKDEEAVAKVKDFLKDVKGFKSVTDVVSERNKGCANSIKAGVSQIINDFGSVITVEDDIVTTPNFLNFMNQCLEKYEHNDKVFSISGYTFPVKIPQNYAYDGFFIQRGSPWGWASWKDRWNTVDWSASKFATLKKDSDWVRRFHEGGSDLSRMLSGNLDGSIDGWDPIWIFQQFLNSQYTIYPNISKVQNVGFGQDATHTKFYDRFRTPQDTSGKTVFNLPEDLVLDKTIIASYKDKYSLRRRLIGRLKHYLGLP